jgi:hypothetical protein
MTRLIPTLLLMVVALPVDLAPQEQACSLSSIKGNYGLVSSLRLSPPATEPSKKVGRVRIIAYVTYDGIGGVSIAGSKHRLERQNSSYTAPAHILSTRRTVSAL